MKENHGGIRAVFLVGDNARFGHIETGTTAGGDLELPFLPAFILANLLRPSHSAHR
jgi:hypothetical protein